MEAHHGAMDTHSGDVKAHRAKPQFEAVVTNAGAWRLILGP
jgi:hypothetical protein